MPTGTHVDLPKKLGRMATVPAPSAPDPPKNFLPAGVDVGKQRLGHALHSRSPVDPYRGGLVGAGVCPWPAPTPQQPCACVGALWVVVRMA